MGLVDDAAAPQPYGEGALAARFREVAVALLVFRPRLDWLVVFEAR